MEAARRHKPSFVVKAARLSRSCILTVISTVAMLALVAYLALRGESDEDFQA